MRIIVDVMGGDNAPDAIALGAIEAAKEEKLDVVLVGRGEAILQCLKNHGMETLPAGVEIANADDVVDMHDDPASVMKTRKNSSMLVGLQMLKDGGGDAFVSAGSTGALLTAATLIVKRIKGVRRAAMGPVIPTKTGGTVLIGLTKPVVKAHGSSDAVAIRSAIRQAAQAVSSGFTDDLRANVEQMMVPKELEHVQKS